MGKLRPKCTKEVWKTGGGVTPTNIYSVQPEHRELKGTNKTSLRIQIQSFGFNGLATLHPFRPTFEVAKI